MPTLQILFISYRLIKERDVAFRIACHLLAYVGVNFNDNDFLNCLL
jgi:hypothetical protein